MVKFAKFANLKEGGVEREGEEGGVEKKGDVKLSGSKPRLSGHSWVVSCPAAHTSH